MTEVKEKEATVIEGVFERGGPMERREHLIDEARVRSAELARRATLEFTEEQQKMIRDSIANGMSNAEFGVFIAVCKARKLNPLLKQIHPVKRWDSTKGCDVWSYQVGIDGFRVIAQRTGEYDGQDPPEYELDAKGEPIACTIKVWRKGVGRPFVATARYAEYVQKTRDGKPNTMWTKMPFNQLAKCAESLALRKAFPEDLSGLYTDEEMEQADAAIATSGPRTPAGAATAGPTTPAQNGTYNGLVELLASAETDAQCKTVGRDAYAFLRLRTITQAQLEEFVRLVDAKRANIALAAREAVMPDNKKANKGADAPTTGTPAGEAASNAPSNADGERSGSSVTSGAKASEVPEHRGQRASGSETAGETAPSPPKSAPKPKRCGKTNEDNSCDRAAGHTDAHHDERTDAEWP